MYVSGSYARGYILHWSVSTVDGDQTIVVLVEVQLQVFLLRHAVKCERKEKLINPASFVILNIYLKFRSIFLRPKHIPG